MNYLSECTACSIITTETRERWMVNPYTKNGFLSNLLVLTFQSFQLIQEKGRKPLHSIAINPLRTKIIGEEATSQYWDEAPKDMALQDQLSS